MPETKRPIRVFLCHASQDKPAVRELYQRLKKEDWIDPWLDEEKLTLGQHWTSAIEDALDAADVVVIFLSHNSVQKEGFVQRELNYAWEISLEKPRNVIFLIPFRLDDCKFRDTCTPCPLLTHEVRISECEVALAVSNGYDTSVLSRPIYKALDTHEILSSDGRMIILNDGKKFKISDSGFLIWKNIANNNTLSDAINLTHTQAPNIVEQEVVEFIHNLRKTGLVSFDNDFPIRLPINCVLICCAR